MTSKDFILLVRFKKVLDLLFTDSDIVFDSILASWVSHDKDIEFNLHGVRFLSSWIEYTVRQMVRTDTTKSRRLYDLHLIFENLQFKPEIPNEYFRLISSKCYDLSRNNWNMGGMYRGKVKLFF